MNHATHELTGKVSSESISRAVYISGGSRGRTHFQAHAVSLAELSHLRSQDRGPISLMALGWEMLSSPVPWGPPSSENGLGPSHRSNLNSTSTTSL